MERIDPLLAQPIENHLSSVSLCSISAIVRSCGSRKTVDAVSNVTPCLSVRGSLDLIPLELELPLVQRGASRTIL